MQIPFRNAIYVLTQSYPEHVANKAEMMLVYRLTGYDPGNDFAVPIGTDLYPLATGRVTKVQDEKDASGNSTGYGLHVHIEHELDNVWFTAVYAHLLSVNVTVGQIVGLDTVIAKTGNSGSSSGPHSHIGTQNADGEFFDWFEYISNDPPIPPLPAGDWWKVKAGINYVNIRLIPGAGGARTDRGDVYPGDRLLKAPGVEPVQADGITWQPIVLWIAQGYNGEDYLE